MFGLSYYLKGVEINNGNKVEIEYSQVVVAVNEISENTKITEDMVTLKSIPTEAVHPDAVTSVDMVIGGMAEVEIVSGEQVLSNKVITDVEKAALAYRIPENMRAMAIPVNEIVGVAGYINEGDNIDILVTYTNVDNNKDVKNGKSDDSTTYTQFQNIQVIAVGNAVMIAADKQSVLPNSITLLVTPNQAEVLAYAILNGSVHCTLRNPADSGKSDLQFYNTTNFETYKEME